MATDLAVNLGHNTPLLVHAAAVSAKKSNDKDTALVLKNKFFIPSDSNKARKNLFTQKNDSVRLTEDEALAYLLENSLSKSQCINFRELSISRSCELLAAYNKVREAKLKCRPFDINVTKSVAEVPLQSLLDHTSCRIIQMQEDLFEQLGNTLSLTLIVSYGFDGTTGQSSYKQHFFGCNSLLSDDSLFAKTIILLKLMDHIGNVFWINRTFQSIRFCRPVKLEFVTETKDHILAEKNNLDNQIIGLSSYVCTVVNGKSISVEYDLQMTLLDGKVLNILTETKSCQLWPICGASQKTSWIMLIWTHQNLSQDIKH